MLVFDSFLGTHYLGMEEEKAAVEVIRSQSLFRYDGPHLLRKTEEFEKNLREFFSTDYVIACSSGASALKMCCVALNIGYGDEVLMSPFTYIASAGAVLSCGAVVNFVDVDMSMNINPDKIENVITERTKAILVVHIQGVPCDMKRVLEVARKHKLYVIEDCAQAFGSSYEGKRVGTWGDAAAFSLQANKVITAGEGGVFVCNTQEKYERARMYHDNGGLRVGNEYPTWESEVVSFGENYKITELQSAIANEQLKKFNKILEKQKELFKMFINRIKNNKFQMRMISDNVEHIPVSLCFIFESVDLNDDFIKQMNKKGIGFELYCDKVLTSCNTFKNKKSWHSSGFPYNVQPYKVNSCEFTTKLINRTTWMAISPLLDKDDVEHICADINAY